MGGHGKNDEQLMFYVRHSFRGFSERALSNFLPVFGRGFSERALSNFLPVFGRGFEDFEINAKLLFVV